MKTYKLLLPLLVSALALAGLLIMLHPDQAAADVSREQVGNWYFKDGGWTDYAPNGVPDFDQKQNPWVLPSTTISSHCGPVAVANSLWWFDSKFEPSPVGPSGGPPSTMPISDSYYLVTACGGALFDDHDPQNVGGMGQPGLVDDLAWYFDTNGVRTMIGSHNGTEVHDMAIGLQWYLYGGNPAWGISPCGPRKGSYYDDYHVQLVKMPTWEWVVEEVERSEDVILLLGFWQNQGTWVRLGGHYVTVPGINAAELQIAFSDPFLDNAENPGQPGRVLSGTLFAHLPTPGHPVTVHNDAGNISHDFYTVTLAALSPGGLWEIEGYEFDTNFENQNVPVEFIPDTAPGIPGAIFVEVEYALAMSPFKWKPGGEWVDYWNGVEWDTEWWWYKDDGDSCMPDFKWGDGELWYDGPTALTNSFWWFDSKAETLKTGGIPHPPPVITDHYDLIMPWGDWDDHDTRNITPTINTMASFLNTGISGTTRVSMTNGIGLYLTELSGVADDFYTKTQDTPSWEWIADEVETCEDVLMLLGFYEDIGGGTWQRKGGHWVNAAGVNRTGWFLGLSDPAINNAVSPTLRTGRVFPPEHITTPFTPTEQLNPQALSHDIYRVITSTAFEGQLLLKDYPFTHTSVLTNFVGLNEGGDPIGDWGNQFETVIEWAIGVSPHSDLEITKTANVTQVVPGDVVTYVLSYANTGLAAVENVTITDQLNLTHLTDVTYTTYPPIWATQGVTFAWTLPKLSYGQTGTITITGEALVTTTLYNEATITGTTSIGHPTPDKDQDDNSGEVGTPRYYLYLPLVLRNY